jgi:hypothetical protein
LGHGQTEALAQHADGAGAGLGDRAGDGRLVGFQRRDPRRRPQGRQMGAIRRIALQEQLMGLVAQARRLDHGCIALRHQHLEYRCFILGCDPRQGGALAPHIQGDRLCIALIGLALVAGAPAFFRRPAGIHLMDRLAGGQEVLGQAAAVVPRPFDPPAALASHALRPLQQLSPTLGAIRPRPLAAHLTRVVDRHRDMAALVRVDADADHPLPPVSFLQRVARAQRRTGFSAVSDRHLSGHVR